MGGRKLDARRNTQSYQLSLLFSKPCSPIDSNISLQQVCGIYRVIKKQKNSKRGRARERRKVVEWAYKRRGKLHTYSNTRTHMSILTDIVGTCCSTPLNTKLYTWFTRSFFPRPRRNKNLENLCCITIYLHFAKRLPLISFPYMYGTQATTLFEWLVRLSQQPRHIFTRNSSVVLDNHTAWRENLKWE